MTPAEAGAVQATVRGMNSAEAGAVELEEPDWRERFEEHCLRWPRLPRYLAEDSAFEATLRDWRRFHFTWVEDDDKPKQRPAGATEAMIALAKLRIFPPRFLIKDVPRSDEFGYQQDAHLWLSIAGEQWRIVGVEDRMLCLEKSLEDRIENEARQIDLSRAKWEKYVEAAVMVLEGMRGTNQI